MGDEIEKNQFLESLSLFSSYVWWISKLLIKRPGTRKVLKHEKCALLPCPKECKGKYFWSCLFLRSTIFYVRKSWNVLLFRIWSPWIFQIRNHHTVWSMPLREWVSQIWAFSKVISRQTSKGDIPKTFVTYRTNLRGHFTTYRNLIQSHLRTHTNI